MKMSPTETDRQTDRQTDGRTGARVEWAAAAPARGIVLRGLADIGRPNMEMCVAAAVVSVTEVSRQFNRICAVEFD